MVMKTLVVLLIHCKFVQSNQCYRETIKETGCAVGREFVAFSAYMSDGFVVEHSKSLSTGKTFIFDQTETNIDSAYDPTTGIFKAPYTGHYAFTWTLCADSRVNDSGLGEFGSQLIVDERVVGAVHSESESTPDDDCATGFVITHTTKGANVLLRNVYMHTGALLSKSNQTRCTFSGWKMD